jgi:ABC-2 type transport system ATP-binding protein
MTTLQTETVACQGVTKVYGGKVRALDSVSFEVPARGIFSLIGRNGAGKTTLVRILATELEPTYGRASIKGMDVMKDADRLRERIAIVPQEARAISWMTPKQTVLSYLLWRGVAYDVASRRAVEALERVGLEGQANVLNRRLSGGTKRKVLVATVLASEADIIFLDEPTTGLDPVSRRELWGTLKHAGSERFTFLTTHYLEEAEQLADRIGILKDGKLAALGTLAELRRTTEYQYSVRVPPGISIRVPEGETSTVEDGSTQVLLREDDAFRVSKRLLEEGVRFSISPVSLDDIFLGLSQQTEEAVERTDEEEQS